MAERGQPSQIGAYRTGRLTDLMLIGYDRCKRTQAVAFPVRRPAPKPS